VYTYLPTLSSQQSLHLHDEEIKNNLVLFWSSLSTTYTPNYISGGAMPKLTFLAVRFVCIVIIYTSYILLTEVRLEYERYKRAMFLVRKRAMFLFLQ
jgi:hypothetical protein